MTEDVLLGVSAVGKRYREGTALKDFSLAFGSDDRRIVALVGQSGAGKTTAAQLALGLKRPTSGAVRYRGTPLSKLSRRQRRHFRQDVQAVLQDPYAAFNPFYRVHHVFDVTARNFDVGDPRRAVPEAIETVGLDPNQVLAAYPHELSGGERQRLMLARAFLTRPRVIVADEPVSMVDAPTRTAILEVMLELREEAGLSFLYITHDLSTVYQLADELVVLHAGETVERGPARTVIDAPRHARTRELIDAVPVPDPDVRWAGVRSS